MATNEPRWHVEALDDAQTARDWYAKRSPLAARGFLLELADAVDSVVRDPDCWPRGRANTRRFVFPRRYPFTLVYRINENDEIEIVAVAHHKRQPEFWLHR